MRGRRTVLTLAAGALASAGILMTASIGGAQPPAPTSGELLVEGLAGTIGGGIGPDGALYVAESGLGQITRIDPETGEATLYGSGLPATEEGGGAYDVAFIGDDAYALTTGLTEESDGTNGIYLVSGEDDVTLIADIGQFNLDNPVDFGDAIPEGNPFALHAVDDGFLVTDGNHNRVLHVTLDGDITEIIAFDNIVPTGIEVEGDTVYIAEVGPFPHTADTGKVVAFEVGDTEATEVAVGVPYIIDVTTGPGGALYALSFGDPPADLEGDAPAEPFTGRLLTVNEDGTFSVLVANLMWPTSLDFVDDTAYIVTLTGEVWVVENVSTLQPIEEETPTPTAEPTDEPTEEPTEVPTATATSVPPTAVPTTVPPTPTTVAPQPPDTGSGGFTGSGSSNDLWLVLGAATLFILAGGSLVAATRRQ